MRAPLFLGGRRLPGIVELPEAELVSLATEELAGAFGVQGAPLAQSVVRHRGGIPQYLLGHRERVARIEALAARHDGLWLCGSGLRGPGMDALVRDAVMTAKAVVDQMQRQHRAPFALSLHQPTDAPDLDR